MSCLILSSLEVLVEEPKGLWAEVPMLRAKVKAVRGALNEDQFALDADLLRRLVKTDGRSAGEGLAPLAVAR